MSRPTITTGPLRLHLGCGSSIKDGWINLDSRPLRGVDVVRDVLRGLPFSDATIDEAYSENFLEHLPQEETIWFLNELWRVMKPRGSAVHILPEAGTILDIADPTHRARWHRETFTYFELGHGRNMYYGPGAILPWIIEIRTYGPNELLHVTMEKPGEDMLR